MNSYLVSNSFVGNNLGLIGGNGDVCIIYRNVRRTSSNGSSGYVERSASIAAEISACVVQELVVLVNKDRLDDLSAIIILREDVRVLVVLTGNLAERSDLVVVRFRLIRGLDADDLGVRVYLVNALNIVDNRAGNAVRTGRGDWSILREMSWQHACG